jgi:hypothetical protein
LATIFCLKRSTNQKPVILSATSPFVYEWLVESKDPYQLELRRHGKAEICDAIRQHD